MSSLRWMDRRAPALTTLARMERSLLDERDDAHGQDRRRTLEVIARAARA